jgi:hypothetical protein
VDLFAVRNLILSSTTSSSASATDAVDNDNASVVRLEIVPLDTTLLDYQTNYHHHHPYPAQAQAAESSAISTANNNNKGAEASVVDSSAIVSTSPIISHSHPKTSSQQQQQQIWSSSAESSMNNQYDPNTPRTGRWTDEELAYRDAIIYHFTNGSLPLCNGLRLTDFLCGILNSRPSRLTKKLKHAKLSANLYRIQTGHLSNSSSGSGTAHHGGSNNIGEGNNSNNNNNSSDAVQFSKLEYNFIHAITNPNERHQIIF